MQRGVALLEKVSMSKEKIKVYTYSIMAAKHRTLTRGHKCDYKKQINEERC